MPVDSNLLKGYHTALEIAVETLRSADLAALALRCGAIFYPVSKSIRLEYLGQIYLIDWPGLDVRRLDSDVEVAVTTKVLLLNYILSARSHTRTGELIAFRDLPGAATYAPSFEKRAVAPLARTFDNKSELLLAAADRLGGVPAAIGDAAVTLPILPLLEITYAVWHSDDEFPARGAILFDSSVRRLMNAECMVVAASNGVYRLIGLLNELQQPH